MAPQDRGPHGQRQLPFADVEPAPSAPSSETGATGGVAAGAAALAEHPFVLQLAELCRRHPTRAKWLVVPTYAVGHGLGERLARQGCAWANLRVTTPLDLAIRMAGPFLVERGVDPSEEPLGPALVMRLLAELPETHGYFRPMAEHTTLAAALWAALREVRFAGFRAQDLPRAAFESAGKHAELAALLAAYERHLAENGIADMAEVFEEAPRHPTFCPVQVADVVVELPDVAWPPLVRRFLDGLPGDRVTPRSLEIPGLGQPSRLGGLAAPVDRVGTAATSDASRLRFLRVPSEAGPPSHDGTLDLFHAGGRDAEMDEVFRRVLAAGAPLDQVEICGATDAHLLLAWEKARRLGWPVTVSRGIAAVMTRPGRALLSWCDWIDGGFASGDLRRLLQSGDIAPKAFRTGEPDGVDPGSSAAGPQDTVDGPGRAAAHLSASQAARVLLRAEVAWGREAYRRSLIAYATSEELRATRDEGARAAWRRQRAVQARQLLAWVEPLLEAVPQPDEHGLIALGAVLDAAARFVTDDTSRRSDFDAAAHVALGEAIDGLRALGAPRVSLPLALRFIREAVESMRVGGQRPRPGHLHVSLLADPGLDARPTAFVVGLEEARVFPAAVEDPVLLDDERRAMAAPGAAPLRTAEDRLDEAVFTIVSRLAALGLTADRLILSFSCTDTREFRETFPSWLILQAFRILQGDARLGYERLRAWLAEPRSAVPASRDQACTDAAWWLAAGRSGEAAVPAVRTVFTNVARGLAAERERASDVFTPYDGLVSAAGEALDPARNGRTVSATTLEDAAECPFRFFLKTGLGIEPIEDGRRDDDVWLDPLTRGSELHELYAMLTRRARDDDRQVSRGKDLRWFLALGRARLEQLRREMPPPSDEVFEVERDELLRDLEAFVDLEARPREGVPLAFEVSFGRRFEGEPEPLAQEAPVPVALGGKRRLALSGRIDRIDRIAPHTYEIIDYKTGRYWRDDYQGVFVGGRLLQHALYGVAAEALLARLDARAKVARGVYWFPTGRGWGKRVLIERPTDGEIAEVLNDLTGLIGDGAFTHTPEERVCDWCDVRKACGSTPWAAAGRKLDVNGEGRLSAWQRLRERR